MGNFVRRFVKTSVACHKAIIILAVVITALAGWVASGLTVESDVENMIPSSNPAVTAFKAVNSEFDGNDKIIIAVSGEGGDAEAYIELLAERLVSDGLATHVFYRIDPAFREQYGLLYLPGPVYERLDKELSQAASELSLFLDNPGLPSFARLLERRLELFDATEREQLIDSFASLLSPSAEDAAGLEPFFSRAVLGPLPQSGSGYLVSERGELFLMIIKPGIKLIDQLQREEFFGGLQKAIDEVRVSSPRFTGIDAGYTGGQAVQDYESDKIAFNDFLSTAIATFCLIMLIVVVSFRRVGVPLASGFPLLLGTLLTSAFTVAAFGSINLFSVGFAVLLLGLGIDFAIHIIARYSEERANGLSLEDALTVTISHTGAGMIAGALTTAVAFATFYIAEFTALRQMGIISSTGILVVLACMFLLMPAIIAAADRAGSARPQRNVTFSFLGPAGRAVIRYRVVVLTAVILTMALSLNTVLGARINSDFTSMYPKDLPSEKWLTLVQEHFDYVPDKVTLAAEDFEQLKSWTAKLENLPSVAKVESVLDYLPQDQEYKLSVIRELGSRLARGKSKAEQLAEAGNIPHSLALLKERALSLGVPSSSKGIRSLDSFEKILLSPSGPAALAALQEGIGAKAASLTVLIPRELNGVTADDLPEALALGFRGKTGKFLIEVTARGRIWDDAVLAALDSEIQSELGSHVTGMPYLARELITMVKKDVLRVSIIAAAVIYLMLLLLFRSFRQALLPMIPVGVTIYLLLAVSELFNLEINIVNLMGLPLIIGIGVDNGVHICHRVGSEGIGKLPGVLVHTGKAITLTTMTTIIGFGSLTRTNHPGLAGMGKLIVAGMAICLVLTVAILPPLLSLNRAKPDHNTAGTEVK